MGTRSETAILFNLQRFSTEDGPGIRTTLFFKGCPLICPWCHNPEGMSSRPELMWQVAACLRCGDCVTACPNGAIGQVDGRIRIDRNLCEACFACVAACPAAALEGVGRKYSADELVTEVLKDRTFYETSGGGVSLSGGEPLLQPAFVLAFAKRCRASGIHVALDTSGFASQAWLCQVLDHIDLVLFDLKLMNREAHKRLVGVSLDRVLASLDEVVARAIPVWVRTPIIPGHTDTDDNLRGLARHLKSHVPTLERWDLLAFSSYCASKYGMLERAFALAGEPLLTAATMERLTGIARDAGVAEARWSGPTRDDAE